MSEENSIVEYFAEHEGYKCGYCKSTNTNYSHGMWCHSLTPRAYENLINRGWRRSGRYMYKPTNEITCCPAYTISNHALNFNISKSQKKCIKKFNSFINNSNMENKSFVTVASIITEYKLSKKASNPQKAKFKRVEKRNRKLVERGLDPLTVPRRPLKSPKKSLEQFLTNSKNLVIKKYKFGTEEFNSSLKSAHELYEKYQMKIHGDSKDECSFKQFKRFLCESPFKNTENHTGTYHHHYEVNGKLLAVGVVDILPTCLSSVYFFYDPVAVPKLSLGTVGALYEIALVREMNQSLPQFQFYYLGFYIHNCKKMRYKGSFCPSYLLCPRSYTWHLLDNQLRDKLDLNKYTEFDTLTPTATQDHTKSLILYSHCILPYEKYASIILKTLNKPEQDQEKEEIQQYVNLVGDNNAQLLLLFRDKK